VVTPKHILGTFDEALSELRNDLLTMAGLTERNLYSTINGLLSGTIAFAQGPSPRTKKLINWRSKLIRPVSKFWFATSRSRPIYGR
jgi:phosphate uptake regulator